MPVSSKIRKWEYKWVVLVLAPPVCSSAALELSFNLQDDEWDNMSLSKFHIYNDSHSADKSVNMSWV